MRFSQQYQPLLLILGGIASVDAFWRTNCQGQIANVRIDPIADYGKPGGHVHNLHGSNGKSISAPIGDSCFPITNGYFLFVYQPSLSRPIGANCVMI